MVLGTFVGRESPPRRREYMVAGRRWTKEEVARLRKYGREASIERLMRIFDRSEWSIRSKLLELGIHRAMGRPKKRIEEEPEDGLRNDCMPNPFANKCCRKQFDTKYYLRR